MLDDKDTNSQKGIDRFDVEAVNSAKVREPLYAARKKIFPKRAKGSFRRLKWILMFLTLAVYYITPWLKWDRGEYVTDQAVLIDLANRRFFFFWIEIWPQEFYYIAGLLVMAGIGLFLITSTVGRAWCGYTCPQTVWVDLFMAVERAIEGERNARIKLDAAPWSLSKIVKRISKHIVWLLVAISTGGAWVFYFADAPQLARDLVNFEAAPAAYITIAVLTAFTYIFGGFMREQVCTYMCPWPRIQAAMLDEHSATVTYNDWRGEPRNRHMKKAIAEGKIVGDCIECNACVVVCPMGIDIRDGNQLECITCALCIDACDDVMGKIGREKGLISYTTLNDYNDNVAVAVGDGDTYNPKNIRTKDGNFVSTLKHSNWKTIIRPRTILYAGVLAAIGFGMLYVLNTRDRLAVNLLHDRNPLFVLLSDGSVSNGFDVKILNMTPEPRTVTMSLEGLDGGTIRLAGHQSDPLETLTIEIDPDQVQPVRLYIHADPDDLLSVPQTFYVVVSDVDGSETATAKAIFEAPK
ncbi:MAG: cytochrome c oxidase accessory protein CcoG [Devosiaceae bacterium]|nr:cytochrome c oxidase accessory protein CcoG [Devosiaceae bacterium]